MPTYLHPEFIIEKNYDRTDSKRFFLELTLNKNSSKNLLVIMKNPSRATLDVSDKTVFNVCNYVYLNKNNREELKNIGKIIILNLIPHYETYSGLLKNYRSEIICDENLKVINKYSAQNSNVIIAWGNHPSGLRLEFELLKESVLSILRSNKNDIYFVDKLSNAGNPKHAQIWGYENELVMYN